MIAAELSRDAAVREADTLLLTVPNQLGVDYNAQMLETIAREIGPAIGWQHPSQRTGRRDRPDGRDRRTALAETAALNRRRPRRAPGDERREGDDHEGEQAGHPQRVRPGGVGGVEQPDPGDQQRHREPRAQTGAQQLPGGGRTRTRRHPAARTRHRRPAARRRPSRRPPPGGRASTRRKSNASDGNRIAPPARTATTRHTSASCGARRAVHAQAGQQGRIARQGPATDDGAIGTATP